MSDNTPTPPPLPEQPADQAAARLAATPPTSSAGPAYNPANKRMTPAFPRAAGEASDIGRGFLSALFDISFRTFITRRLASAFYVVGLIAIGIGFLVWFVRGIFVGIDLLLLQRRRGRLADRRDPDPRPAWSRSCSPSSCSASSSRRSSRSSRSPRTLSGRQTTQTLTPRRGCDRRRLM